MSRAAWSAGRIAAVVDGRLVAGDARTEPAGNLSVDTRLLAPGDVFLGLPGEHVDGGGHVPEALARGAAGVVGAAPHIRAVTPPAFAIAVADPHDALRRCARGWRAELRCEAIGVTGAAGKTTTTDILAALLRAHVRTHATRRGFNTTQGVAATVAGAPADTGALVVELAMYRQGDIAAGAELLRPTAGVITNIGPEHLETAGTVADVARNKAELIAALPAGAPCVVPAGEPLLRPHLRQDLRTVTHGPEGDVRLLRFQDGVAEIDCRGERVALELGFSQPHRLRNTVAAVATAWALGHRPAGRIEVAFSPLRWERRRLGEIELVLDCAKNSPLALASALADFAAEPAGRRIAVLAAMPGLGDQDAEYHHAAGEQAARAGIDLVITVGAPARRYLDGFTGPAHAVQTPEEARQLLREIGRAGDRVLVKGTGRAALERIAERPPGSPTAGGA
jgi:UDP-N-acetylmuramoyl-tripeptide--D-alanyl-D-alanine ligase